MIFEGINLQSKIINFHQIKNRDKQLITDRALWVIRSLNFNYEYKARGSYFDTHVMVNLFQLICDLVGLVFFIYYLTRAFFKKKNENKY